MRIRHLLIIASGVLLLSPLIWAQAGAKPAAGQSLPVALSSAHVEKYLRPSRSFWLPFHTANATVVPARRSGNSKITFHWPFRYVLFAGKF